jgi:hypothetical protein
MSPAPKDTNAGYLDEYLYEVVVGFHPSDDELYNKVSWVTQFCRDLQKRLSMFLGGGQPRVWNSDRIRGNQQVRQTTLEALQRAATLVAILSPRYLGEDNLYAQHTEKFAQAIAGSVSATRLFNIYKLRCRENNLGDLLGYQFWTETDDGVESELIYEDGDAHYRKLTKLANDIRETLQYLKQARDDRPQVYLALPASQLRASYETVLEYLRAFCRVVPDPRTLPITGIAPFAQTVEGLLSGSQLSIHLFGVEDDPPPVGFGGTTPTRIQFDLACQRARRREMDCILWCGENPLDPAVREDALIRSILLQRDLPSTVDKLMPEGLAQLKDRIRKRLGVQKAQNASLYVIRHPVDKHAVAPLEDELRAAGFRIKTADGEYQSLNFLAEHARILNESAAAVICGGDAPIEWLRFSDYSVRMHLGQKPGSDLDRFAVYLGPEKTDEKAAFSGSTPLRDYGEFRPFQKQRLDSFLGRL